MTPTLIFSTWFKIFLQESDKDKYLRTNQEQRLLQKQLERNKSIAKLTGSVVGGAFFGAKLGGKFLGSAIAGASSGSIGGALGAIGGALLGMATFFIAEELLSSNGINGDKVENARVADLEKDFIPSLPNSIASASSFNALSVSNFVSPRNLFSLSLIIHTSYDWEYCVKPYPSWNESNETKTILRNLVSFGELCNKYFISFDLINFIKTNAEEVDQPFFYIRCGNTVTLSDNNWSILFPEMDKMFNYLLETGIRFHYQ